MKRHFTKIAIVIICIGLISTYAISAYKGYKNRNQTNIKIPEIKFTKEGSLSIINPNGETVKKLDIEVAKTPYETQTGLMYRKQMKENRGMLFMFPKESEHSFYMRNTLISLDILYINKDLEIVSVAKEAKPLDETSLPSGTPVQYVLEINGGMMDKWGVEIGDKINFTEN